MFVPCIRLGWMLSSSPCLTNFRMRVIGKCDFGRCHTGTCPAEIKIGKRRVIDCLLSPLETHEAMRER